MGAAKLQTIGGLIDQLCTVLIKLYHQEEIRHPESGFADAERLIASDKICILNRQRNKIVQEIDEYFSSCLQDPSKHKVMEQLKDYKKPGKTHKDIANQVEPSHESIAWRPGIVYDGKE